MRRRRSDPAAGAGPEARPLHPDPPRYRRCGRSGVHGRRERWRACRRHGGRGHGRARAPTVADRARPTAVDRAAAVSVMSDVRSAAGREFPLVPGRAAPTSNPGGPSRRRRPPSRRDRRVAVSRYDATATLERPVETTSRPARRSDRSTDRVDSGSVSTVFVLDPTDGRDRLARRTGRSRWPMPLPPRSGSPRTDCRRRRDTSLHRPRHAGSAQDSRTHSMVRRSTVG